MKNNLCTMFYVGHPEGHFQPLKGKKLSHDEAIKILESNVFIEKEFAYYSHSSGKEVVAKKLKLSKINKTIIFAVAFYDKNNDLIDVWDTKVGSRNLAYSVNGVCEKT